LREICSITPKQDCRDLPSLGRHSFFRHHSALAGGASNGTAGHPFESFQWMPAFAGMTAICVVALAKETATRLCGHSATLGW
jgi:hypothetical protein